MSALLGCSWLHASYLLNGLLIRMMIGMVMDCDDDDDGDGDGR